MTTSDDSVTEISCRGMWKVFGPNPERIIDSDQLRLGRSELLAQTGCTVAVRDVSMDIRKGEVFVVMGLSGSGKSTLIRCLTRLVDPTRGTVDISGTDVLGCNGEQLRELRRHRVAMVFQHFALFPHRRVIDNVAFGLEVRGVDKKARQAKASEILEVVGLSDVSLSYPGQLSGGMQQRVGLARALAVDPDVLIFDEAFSALDPLIRRDMQDEVLRLQESLQKTVVFVSHDLDEALKLGDRIAIMKDGAFVQVGNPSQIVGAPADDYVRDFVQSVAKGRVLTAGWMVDQGAAPEDPSPPETVVGRDTLLSELLPVLINTQGQIGVRSSDGGGVKMLDRARVVEVLSTTAG